MVVHNTIVDPQQLFLKSSDGQLNNSTNKSNVTFELKNTINVASNVDIYIQLNAFKFSNSFYNINATNNIFYYSVSSIGLGIEDEYSFEIPIGNYNVNSLLEYLNSELIGYIEVSYSASTFKIILTASTGTIILRNGVNSCLKLLGFNFEDTIESNILTSPNLINLGGVQMLYISLSNLNISSNTSKNSIVNNILESVNIQVQGGSSQSFTTSTNSKYKLVEKTISKIDILLYDENNKLVDFNNSDWYLNISFIFAYQMIHIQSNDFLDLNNNGIDDNKEK